MFKKLLKKILNFKKEDGHKVIKILGFTIKYKEKPVNNINIEEIVERIKVNNIALKIHSEVFPKYRGIYQGRDIVIVGCGPSVKDYHLNIKGDPVYISVNRAYKIPEIKFDYIFFQDQYAEGFDELAEYRGNNCQKFQAVITKPGCDYIIAQDATTKLNSIRYILSPIVNGPIPYDIAYEPFADLSGTVFSAMQFALYTNPRKIYLVGFDCTDTNYFTNYPSKYEYQTVIWGWMKDFAKHYYSSTEIISINPIGIKGMFRDLYTQDFIKEHPEIKDFEVV